MKVSKFLKDLISTGASQLGVLLFGFILLRIMTAVLNQEHFGLFILIRRWIVVLVPMATLNLSIGLARYISFDKEKARFYLHISLIITTALTVLMLILLILFNKPFSTAFFDSDRYSNLVIVLAFFLFAHATHLITYSYFRGKMDMNTANVIRLLFTGFPVLLGGIALITGASDYSTILCLYFSVYSLWGVVTTVYFLRKECSLSQFKNIKNKVTQGIKGRAFILEESRGLLRYSLARIPSFFFISLIFSFPVIFASHKISVTASGYIGIVVAVLHLLGIFCMPFNLIFLPKFSSLIKEKQVENIKKYSLIILDFIFTFLPIIVIMIFGLTRYIIRIWFGVNYLITVNSVAVAILASVFYLGYALIRGILDGLFEFPFINIINLAGLVTVVALCLSMGTGIFEISAALSCGLFILGVASIFILVKKLRLPFPWLKVLSVLVGCGLIFLLLTVVDNMITGLKLNGLYTFALCVFYRGVFLVPAWWFYWRKTLWYKEMLKRITFKNSIKENVVLYEE
jgi:O-antigen/teichoic acid export membrane protein